MDVGSDTARDLGERVDEMLYRWDELRRRPIVVVGVVLGALLAVGLAWFATSRADGTDRARVEDQIPVVSLAPTSPSSVASAPLLVHVAGAVQAPGVYELHAGDRILDAIAGAGGATSEGQPDRLNLAAPVIDGMQIRVPVEGEAAVVAGPSTERPGSGPVDLNSATAVQLETLPGVGPATAAAILSYRDDVGRFGSVADLLAVRGIGEAKLAALEDLVVVR
ncbi:MAG: helix-hairpin-helix domain-containing protein [Acidimicrobiales bacterium]